MNLTRLDPRSILLSVFVVNATALSYGSLPTLLLCATFSAWALGSVRPVYGLWSLLAFGFFYAGYWGLLQLPPSKLFAFTAALSMWVSRFSISMSIGAFAMLTLKPSTMTAALRRLHIPGWATIPSAVFLRVLPIIVTEARAIYDAMALRGLKPKMRNWLLSPTRSSSMLVIPLLGSVVRSGDELASSALVRGLGGTATPTSTADLKFRIVDALTVIYLVAIVASLWVSKGALQ